MSSPTPTPKATAAKFELYGGDPSLDFVNTVDGMRGFTPREQLSSYPRLLDWALQANLVGAAEAQRLARLAEAQPIQAAAALAEACRLREALHDVLVALLRRKPVPPRELEAVNTWVGSALARRRLIPAGKGVRLGWEEAGDDLLSPLREVAAAAMRLLASPDLERVRLCGQCEEGRCGWLFLDGTRNRSRRFCSSEGCGNRAKVARYYRRQRVQASRKTARDSR
jgi:predicted RNA-binding Zn ribbon-like protein